MYNRSILIGRLTADPELRFTGNGTAVVKFTIACDRPFQNKQGEKETDFIDIVAWRGLAETCANHLSKGFMIAVEGRLEIRSYDDKQGIRRKAAEIVADNVRFLDRGRSGSSASGGGGQATQQRQASQQHEDAEFSEVPFTEDDLPF